MQRKNKNFVSYRVKCTLQTKAWYKINKAHMFSMVFLADMCALFI